MLVAETLIARLACELAARCRARRRGTCGCCGYFGHCNWVLVVAFVVVFAVRLRADWLHCLGFLCVFCVVFCSGLNRCSCTTAAG